MTREELERAIASLGLTQSSLAARLDLSPRTLRRYVAGTAPIPRVVEIAIEHLLHNRRAESFELKPK
jgi:transcriptional regulator with XRE-family HTH domain